MATTKIPARDFTIEIDSAYPGTPAFVAIGGLNSLTPSPSTNRAATTDFDSNRVAEHSSVAVHAGGGLRYEPRGSVALKGIAEPVEVFVARRAQA